MSSKSVCIIGAGIGGLVTALILSKEGYKVTLIEKNPRIGGCLQTFKRDGVTFDTGMHYIGSMNDGQVLNRIFRYLDIYDLVEMRKLNEEGFDRITIQGKEYVYPVGYERLVETFSEAFPSERDAILKYTGRIQEIAKGIDLYNLREMDESSLMNLDHLQENAWDFISATTQNPQLRQLFSSLNSLYAGKTSNTFLYVHALINNHYIEGPYRFVNGSEQVANALAQRIKENGGEVRTSVTAEKFLFEDKKLVGLKTAEGEEIFADYFVSGIHPAVTMDMIEEGKIRKSYKSRLKNIPNTISSFSIYASVHEESMPYLNSNYYYYLNDSVWGVDTYKEMDWPGGFALYPLADRKDTRYTRGFSVMTYMDYKEVLQWENTSVEKRGAEYKAFKKEKAEKLLDLVEQRFPEIRKQIRKYYTSTPLTFRDYTATPEGSMYGVVRDSNRPIEAYIFPRTKIPNLLLTGQNLNLHGFLGVSLGAFISSGELCGGVNNIIRKLNQ